MHSFAFYISLATIVFRNTSAYYFDPDKAFQRPAPVDANILKNAAEVVLILKKLNAQKHLQRNEQLQGIDLDYLGLNDQRDKDGHMMSLVKNNYFQRGENVDNQLRSQSRTYYISNPDVLEEYKKNHEGSSSDSRQKNEKEIANNVLMLIKHLRRDGDNDNLESDKDASKNRDEPIENADENKSQPLVDNIQDKASETEAFGEVESTTDHAKSPEVSELLQVKEEVTAKFKARDDYDKRDSDNDNAKKRSDDGGEKDTTKFNFKVPIKTTRDDEDIKKSIESFKNSWQNKRETTKRWADSDEDRERRNKAPKRYDDFASRPRFKPEFLDRNRGNAALNNNGYGNNPPYHSYGRTPVPVVGKKNIYEDDKK